METQEDTTDKEKGMILAIIYQYILYDLAVILIQIIMVSPGTHLVKNHESQFKKIIIILHLWGYLCIRDAGC